MSRSNLKEFIRQLHVTWLRFKARRSKSLPSLSKVLIIAPHPDDEVIGCGGLIARLTADGHAPHVVILTGGEGSHRGCCEVSTAEIVEARRGLTSKASGILGVPIEKIHELDYPDGGISDENHLTEELKRLIAEIQPQSVLVPHWGEGWPDHVRTAEIVKSIVPPDVEVWEYCVWMWYYNVWRGLDWKNAAVLRMTPAEHALKLRAMDAYIRPLAPCGKPWSGNLPPLFVNANRGNTELYFKRK